MHLPTLLTAVAPLAALLATPAEAHAPSRARSHVAAAHGAAKLDTSSSSSFVHDAPDHALLAKRAPRRRKTTCSPSSGAPTPSAPVLIVSPTSTKSLTPTPTSSKAAAPAPTEDKYNSKWKLDLVANGTSFFDSWSFWNYDDPTHGTVRYQSEGASWDQGLVSFNGAGHAVLKADTTKHVQGGRNSVRLHSNYVFNGGLILMDSFHMPTGCGAWPAWWANGPNWPNGGEIDILEGVNEFTHNQVSLHTGSGCRIPNDFDATGVLTRGNYDSLNCASYETSNSGCGQRDAQTPNAYGKPFNDNKGGVYAMKWDATGITVHFFPREAIPDDIKADQPTPEKWGRPMGHFPSTSCNPYQFFKDNFAILNLTFCGDWAAGVWHAGGFAGQDQSCAVKTGYNSCEDYVLNNGDAFSDAYWEIGYVKYFQPK